MRGVKKLGATALIVLFVLNSCTDFFTTSWGELFKRDPNKVKVTASNVYDLLDAAKGDPELSRAILDKINAGSDDTLKRAAIKAANQAAGISTVVLENVGDLIDAADSNKDDREEAFRKVAENIQKDMTSNDITGIAKRLTGIFEEMVSYPSSDTPRDALINARGVTVSVPKTDGGAPGTATITVDENGVGTATIVTTTGGGPLQMNYPCEITDAGITLKGAGENGTNVVLPYNIDNGDYVTLHNLDDIAGLGLAEKSSSSTDPLPPGKPEFEEGFLDSVSEADLTLLVITLILAKAESVKETWPTLEEYFETWQTKNVETGKELDEEEKLIAAIVNGMISRGELTGDESELTKMLKDLLEQNKDK
jgi:hypothetical protein